MKIENVSLMNKIKNLPERIKVKSSGVAKANINTHIQAI